MNLQGRDFLLLVTLGVAAATPVWGQSVAPAVGPANSGTQSAASIPDFSGIWGHLTWPDVEPPLAGPGPVRNKSLRNGMSDIYQLVGDYTNPILKPHAAQVVKKAGEIALSGVTYPTPSNRCWPGGVPFVFWNIGMQMLQQPHQIMILYANDYAIRRVRMNEPHPAEVTPTWDGDSVGHYEGDTLVIDTVGVKVGPFPMVDMYGTPHTEALHVVERYVLLDYAAAKEELERAAKGHFRIPAESDFEVAVVDLDYRGKGLQLQFTVEDDNVFTTPWSATVTYRRPLGGWLEYVCAENTRESGQRVRQLPQADKPDF